MAHFLSLDDCTTHKIQHLLDTALHMKKNQHAKHLSGKSLAMIFEKPSTRTRISFEVGMQQLGGHSLIIHSRDTQMGRDEPIKDSARVISSMVDAIMIRCHDHAQLETFAAYSNVPVINGLSWRFHPCQLLADLLTWYELKGSIQGKTVTWLGDGNNMCHSWMNAARLLDFTLHIACPPTHQPDQDILIKNTAYVQVFDDAMQAAKGANIITTDTWNSMGQTEKNNQGTFSAYQVNDDIMHTAHKEALFMHCLPAYRGLEVTESVLEGPQSVVFQEAENRLHAQKALLFHLLSNDNA